MKPLSDGTPALMKGRNRMTRLGSIEVSHDGIVGDAIAIRFWSPRPSNIPAAWTIISREDALSLAATLMEVANES